MIPVFRRSAFRFHQKAEFIRGADLKPEPPVTPVAMDWAARVKQVAAMPFVSAAKRK